MWYHVITQHSRERYWWNRSREAMINDVLIPFVTKQVHIVNKGQQKAMFNFGTATYMTIIRTNEKLKRPKPNAVPIELKDKKFIREHNVTEEFINELRIISSNNTIQSILQYSLTPSEKQIFVVMKFNDGILNSAYQRVIKPIGESFGYRIIRVDEIQDSGNINAQILENIAKSKIVLADLTGGKPNCYYEAGFAHALGKEVIFCIHENEKPYFDLSSNRFIQWGTEMEYEEKLKERLTSIQERDTQ